MSDQSGAGATPNPTQSGQEAGATPIPTNAGTVVLPATPPAASEMPTPDPTTNDGGRRDADSDAQRDDDRRDAELSPADLQKALNASRKEARENARELKRLRDAEKAREDANKSELERAVERAEAAEARAATLERANQARDVAAEFGIPNWADELANDPDTRTMRAHAERIRQRINPGSPGMDGGVRGLGAPVQPSSMDDLIRGVGRR